MFSPSPNKRNISATPTKQLTQLCKQRQLSTAGCVERADLERLLLSSVAHWGPIPAPSPASGPDPVEDQTTPTRSRMEGGVPDGLGGVWHSEAGVTESGTYFVSERPDGSVLWLGLGAHGAWSHVFLGRREGEVVRGKWADIPLGQMKYQMRKGGGGSAAAAARRWQPYHGKLAVRIGADGAMQRIDAESSDFGCTQWRRASPPDAAIPDLTEAVLKCAPVAGDGLTGVYDNDVLDHGVGSGMYFVTQVDDSVFWLGQSKTAGQYANVAVGSVKRCVGGAMLLEMQWADVPWRTWAPSNFSGALTLSADEIAGTIEKVQDTSGLFGGRLWQKRLTPAEADRAATRFLLRTGMQVIAGNTKHSDSNGTLLRHRPGLADCREEKEKVNFNGSQVADGALVDIVELADANAWAKVTLSGSAGCTGWIKSSNLHTQVPPPREIARLPPNFFVLRPGMEAMVGNTRHKTATRMRVRPDRPGDTNNFNRNQCNNGQRVCICEIQVDSKHRSGDGLWARVRSSADNQELGWIKARNLHVQVMDFRTVMSEPEAEPAAEPAADPVPPSQLLGQPPASAAPKPTTQLPWTVDDWLLSIKLDRYTVEIKELGYDELDFLTDIAEADVTELMDAVAMKPGHKKIFLKKWKALIVETTGGGGGGAPVTVDVATEGHGDVDSGTAGSHTLAAAVADPGAGRRQIFASMRFKGGGILPEAKLLQAALAKHNVPMRIIDMAAGVDIDTNVFSGIEACDTFLVFGTAGYGEDTGNQSSTFYESKYAHGMKKRIVLIRMIPFEKDFVHLQGRVIFGMNKLCLSWMEGEPMPANIVADILKAIDDPSTAPPPAA